MFEICLQISTNVPVIPVLTEERVLTKLMDISATVRLDSQESTVKLVSTPLKFECSINMTNYIFILHGMELAGVKGPPVTQH